MKHALLAALAVAVASCATESPPEFYRALGASKRLEISAKHEPLKGFNGTVFVYIDGEQAISKPVPFLAGNAVEAHGEWRGKRVRASIVRVVTLVSNYHRCDVFIDGEHAATLTL